MRPPNACQGTLKSKIPACLPPSRTSIIQRMMMRAGVSQVAMRNDKWLETVKEQSMEYKKFIKVKEYGNVARSPLSAFLFCSFAVLFGE